MTVEQLIDRAMLRAHVIASGESPTATERTDALNRLNSMIEAWNAEPNAIVKQTVTEIAASGNNSASLGTRPLLILGATAIFAGAVTQPVEVCTPARWAEIALDRAGTATFAKGLICDYGHPTATLHWGPRFTGTLQIVQLLPAFTEFAGLETTVTLPPGYAEALLSKLAHALASDYGRPMDVVASLKAASDAAIAGLGTLNQATRAMAAVPAQ